MSFSGNIDQATLIMIGAGLATFFVMMLVFVIVARARSRLRLRMTRINQRYTGKVVQRTTTRKVSVKRKQSYSSFAQLDSVLQRVIPRPALLRERLRMTGKPISIGEYALANVLIAAVVAYLVNKFVGLSLSAALLGGIAIGLGLPHMLIGVLIKRRIKKFNDLFPEALELIVRGLKSGLPIQESIKVVGKEIGDPVGVEFREIANQLKLGQTIEDAMWDTSRRLNTPEFKFFVISLTIQRETGGNLTETLENLSEILRKRRQMRLKIKAMSSEARASALIIGSLPFAMFGILFALNPAYIMQLFAESRGIMLMGFGLLSMSIGFLVMAKMIRFEI